MDTEQGIEYYQMLDQCKTYGFDLDAEEAALLSVPREDGELLLKKLNRKGTDFGEHRINALAFRRCSHAELYYVY